MEMTVVVAPTGAGKNYLLNGIKDLGYENSVSHTTRKIRIGENEGNDYYYICFDDFIEMETRGEFIETVVFGGENYGMTVKEIKTKEERKKIPYLIVEPNGLEQILNWVCENLVDAKVQIVYLDIPRRTRYKNILKDLNYSYKLPGYERRDISLAAKTRINRNNDSIKQDMENYLKSDNFRKVFGPSKNQMMIVHITTPKATNQFINFLHWQYTGDIGRIYKNIFSDGPTLEVAGSSIDIFHAHQDRDFAVHNDDDCPKFHMPKNIIDSDFYFKKFYIVFKERSPSIDNDKFILEYVENIPENIIPDSKIKRVSEVSATQPIPKTKKWFRFKLKNGKIEMLVFKENYLTKLNSNAFTVELIYPEEMVKSMDCNTNWYLIKSKLGIPGYDFSSKTSPVAIVTLNEDQLPLWNHILNDMKRNISDHFQNIIDDYKHHQTEFNKIMVLDKTIVDAIYDIQIGDLK